MSDIAASKRQVAEALLATSFSVFVHLDPRRERVVVPEQFRRQPHLVLEVGLNMPIPIPDLSVDDDGITCTLSFGRRGFWCRVPWSSVFMLVTEERRGGIWPETAPREVAMPSPATLRPPSEIAAPPLRPALAVVDGSEARTESPDQPTSETPVVAEDPKTGAKKQRPSYLKVVK